MVKVKIDMTGWVMSEHGVPDSRLTVIGQAEDYIRPDGRHEAQWLCECECGNKIITLGNSLKKGMTKSCGCLMKETISKMKKKYNSYNLDGEYGIGYTDKGEEFYFDLEDYDKIKDYYWWVDNQGYIQNNKNRIRMHQLILEYTEDFVADHIGGPNSRNDNRKSNLRIATYSQNGMNRRLQSNNTSGVTGVCFYKPYNKWMSQIFVNKKNIKLGYFDNFDDAVAARKKAEGIYFGEFSYENSIQQGVDLFDDHYRNDPETS